jgi:hypothetical protein
VPADGEWLAELGGGGGQETEVARARDTKNEHMEYSFCGSRVFRGTGC